MTAFVLHLQSAIQYDRFDDVESFVAADASGSFGIIHGHARAMTCLGPGLARFRSVDGGWRFLALPGAVVYFARNELFVNTRRYVHDTDYRLVARAWREELMAEEERLRAVGASLKRLEDEMLKRLWQLGREAGGTA